MILSIFLDFVPLEFQKKLNKKSVVFIFKTLLVYWVHFSIYSILFFWLKHSIDLNRALITFQMKFETISILGYSFHENLAEADEPVFFVSKIGDANRGGNEVVN